MLDVPGIPRDRRGIVLLCGFIAAAALGVAALLVQDPIGYGFLALAVIGYYFHQTRLVPTALWLLVAAYGAAGGLAGNPVDWVESALGLLLAVVALTPPPAGDQAHASKADSERKQISSNGRTSAFPEVSPTESSGNAEVSGAAGASDSASEPKTGKQRLRIRAIGRLSLSGSVGDLASGLEEKPVLAFLFKYLLARWASGDPEVARSALGDELSPGVTEASQRERLRKQLYALQKDLPPELASLVRVNRTHIWLDLDGSDSDLADLRALCERVRQRGFLINADLASEIQDVLAKTEGEFLAGFEELENKVNQGRGTAGDAVDRARESITNQRAELVRALAEYQDAIGSPQASIPNLQAALEAQPQRQDLARLLVVAYLKTGQTARASEVRRQFALKQE